MSKRARIKRQRAEAEARANEPPPERQVSERDAKARAGIRRGAGGLGAVAWHSRLRRELKRAGRLR